MLTARLGDILVDDYGVCRTALETRVNQACSRLGDTLRAHGLIDDRTLAGAMARRLGLPRFDLLSYAPDPLLFTPRDIAHYLHYRFIPYRRHSTGIELATSEPSKALMDFARAHYGCEVTFGVSSTLELRRHLANRGITAFTRISCLSLKRHFRPLMANRVLSRPQRHSLFVLLSLMLSAFVFAPLTSWHALLVLANVFYLASLILRAEFYRQGITAQKKEYAKRTELIENARAIPSEALPDYTILVPLYRESSAVLSNLIQSLRALDYPPELLDIKLICEADDTPTLSALRALAPPSYMEILEVPPSLPRTKPKACNYALVTARGQYLVIYDAEDAPEPNQLRMAVTAFRGAPPEVACLQASLNYYNRTDNLLTRCFSMEYSSLFRLLLPGLERMGIPIPLGGTSNHLQMDVLRELGGWDAFNVTEDADLGIRLAYAGYRTSTLPSLTLEECPNGFTAWLKQRSRWIKGYLQTWLVYTRDLQTLRKKLGSVGYYGFHFFVGAPALTFLLSPLLWGVFILSLTGLLPEIMPDYLLWLCALSFMSGTVLQWFYAAATLRIEGWKSGYTMAFIMYPFYWLLHSLAAARALIQLIFHPHYWDKTIHGVGRQQLNLLNK